MTFAEILALAGASKHPRKPGQWTPAACAAFNTSKQEAAKLLEAAIAWELTAGRVAKPEDEPAVRQCRDKMDAATAAARNKEAIS